jgi:hypothetical protein
MALITGNSGPIALQGTPGDASAMPAEWNALAG